MKLFQKKEEKVQKNLIVDEIKTSKKLSFEEASAFVQEQMTQNTTIKNKEVLYDEKQRVLSLAMFRNRNAIDKTKEYILEDLKQAKIIVKGYTLDSLTEKIFAKNWGLDGLEKYALDNITDEIRVNGAGKNKIYIVRNGVPEKIDFYFESEEEIEIIIKRLIIEDTGSSIDASNPKLEAVLADGTRLTATCFPITKTWTFILRRPDSFEPTLENYIMRETFNELVWKAIDILARGRASMLFSGNVGSGKTTLMRKIVGQLNEKLRIGVIGKDSEVLLQDHYKDRDIIELQEQEHLGIKMKDLFILMLRESPDVLIIEEFRGAGEAIEAVRACTRGLDGSMATAHFNTAEEAVEGTALFMLEEGLTVPIEMAKLRVARAFNIVIQMAGDAITGKKKIVEITEIGVDNRGQVFYNELVKWLPLKDDNYYGEGNWTFSNKPSDKLIKKLLKGVKRVELKEMGWL